MSTLITTILQGITTIKRDSSTTAMTINGSGYVDTTKASVARVFNNTNFNIPNDTVTQMEFNAVSFDPNSWWNGSTHKFTPTLAGYYHIHASVRWNTSTDFDIADMYLYKNNDTLIQAASLRNERYETLVLTSLQYLNGSEPIYIKLLQNSGGAISVRGNSNGAEGNFSIARHIG